MRRLGYPVVLWAGLLLAFHGSAEGVTVLEDATLLVGIGEPRPL